MIQDAGWSKEASMHGETLFTGFTGSRDWRGYGRLVGARGGYGNELVAEYLAQRLSE